MLPVMQLIPGDPDDPRFAAALAAAGLPASGVQGQCYALADGRGFGMIEGEGADRLLRSVIVPAGERGAGAGTSLVDLLAVQAVELGVERLWLLTTTATDFFLRRGWNSVSRDAAPATIRTSEQFTSLCPASATLMMRDLTR